ncbi:unnamed protein product [Didymodactylos carnosus]|uniref:RanBP2-type domain-containing protein n=1 Tax=Didymodactylos carnosus TaxID=1234261 RepID=A0A815NIM6_9BILA|nr:unnamed protein product [Didymodactylos carnosus]CAF1462900.1 unnamed protein product [Didymodactylos carnosus]CAF4255966.1 unnamed protein product [Didymodactylos carnosus]CAF4312706.1 unnamed protein product [Didymodactylos carnosus]
MGSSQSVTGTTGQSSSFDQWAFGTHENAIKIEDVSESIQQLPTQYFGGKDIDNDQQLHQMQQELLGFDDVFRRLFRRKKKNSKKQKQKQTQQKNNYLQPTYDENYYDPTTGTSYNPYSGEEQTKLDETPSRNRLIKPIYFQKSKPTDVKYTRSNIPSDNTQVWKCEQCGDKNNQANEQLCAKCVTALMDNVDQTTKSKL